MLVCASLLPTAAMCAGGGTQIHTQLQACLQLCVQHKHLLLQDVHTRRSQLAG